MLQELGGHMTLVDQLRATPANLQSTLINYAIHSYKRKAPTDNYCRSYILCAVFSMDKLPRLRKCKTLRAVGHGEVFIAHVCLSRIYSAKGQLYAFLGHCRTQQDTLTRQIPVQCWGQSAIFRERYRNHTRGKYSSTSISHSDHTRRKLLFVTLVDQIPHSH